MLFIIVEIPDKVIFKKTKSFEFNAKNVIMWRDYRTIYADPSFLY